MVYLLSKKAHEYAENLHIEIEKLAGKVISDQSWFCAFARQKCLWLYKSHNIQKSKMIKSDTNNIHYTIAILRLDQKTNNPNYFPEWIKNPCELSHIKVLLLLDYWTQNGSLALEDVASHIIDFMFESSNFDRIISLVWLINSEIVSLLIQKLVTMYPVYYIERVKKARFMELLLTCCTHFTDATKSENSAAVSTIMEFSNRVFEQLTIALEENSNVIKCINMYVIY